MGFLRYIVIYLLPVLLFNIETSAQSSFIAGIDINPSSHLKVISDTDEGLRLSYNSGSVIFDKQKHDEGRFLRLMLPDHAYSSEPGKPQLPVFTRLIDFDRTRNARITISNVISIRKNLNEMGDYNRIFPSQPGLTKAEDPQKYPFVMDKSVYNSTKPYLTDTISINKIGTMRGKSIASLEINPVIYHPAGKYVDIIVSMNIFIEYSEVYRTGNNSKNYYSYDFDRFLSKGLINYDYDDVIPEFSLEPVGMVIVSDTAFKSSLQPLVKWKAKKGFKVTELYIGENGLKKDFHDIKDTLTYIYTNSTQDNPAPTYLMLAGDLDYIPPSEGTDYLTDMYYAEFDGNYDFIPDMFTGRLPASDTNQMKAIVDKIIQYESFMFGDTIKHFRKAVALTGLEEGNITFMDGQVNYATGYFNDNPYETEAYVFNHENNDSIRNVRYDSLKVLMNKGVGFINYTGHGNSSGWLDTGIDFSFAESMTNNSRYPLIISNACLTANYNDNNCLGSSMVREINKGALAFIGCTNDSYWTEDYYWSVGVGPIVNNPDYKDTGHGFYDRFFHINGEKPSEWYTTTGQILYSGNLSVSSSTSPRKQYYWENYVLLGDPSISPYIGKPELLTTQVPDTLPPVLKKISIIAPSFAYAGLSHFDTLWDACHATPSGSVYLNIPETEKDSCLLTISRHNGIPFFKTIYFAESDTAWLSINDVNVSDISGNNNDKADYSENISLEIDIQNAGNDRADNVYLKISSPSRYLSIINDSLLIGSVEAKTEILKTGLDIKVSDSLPDLKIAAIDIELHYNGNILPQATDISLHAPVPGILNCITNDSLTGNGNGLPEPGERVKLIFRLINNGSSGCSGNLFLYNISEYISFDATSLSTGYLGPGLVTEIEVYANISETTPESTDIIFDTELVCGPYTASRTLSIIAGKLTEDFELLNFTTFPWINDTGTPWIITDESAWNNMYSARSGEITHNEKSVLAMQLNLVEKDTLRFWYKVSSEASWDSLVFKVDNAVLINESGEVDWTEAIIPLSKGVHLLEWVYEKDQSVNNGSDCAYIDLVRFPALSFIESAINLIKISSPAEGKSYSDEIISAELTNIGRDTVSLLSMSYTVNNNSPVSETFNTDLKPGDTIVVSFTQTVNMSAEDTYYIRVYLTYPDNHFINDTLKITIISTGIEEPGSSEEGFIIAPNPVKDYIRILCLNHSEDNVFSLYNSSGRMIYRKEIDFVAAGDNVYLYPGMLSSGTYILIICSNNIEYRYKIIKL